MYFIGVRLLFHLGVFSFFFFTIMSAYAASAAGFAEGTIHFLPVFDTIDTEIGVGCKRSYEMLREVLVSARGKREKMLPIWELSENFLTRAEILEHYRTEKFGPKSVLWFHACLHGATDKTEGHFLQTGGDHLLRSDLIAEMTAAMKRNDGQGVIVTTDSCSVPGEYKKRGLAPAGGEMVNPTVPEPWRIIKSLLGRTKGVVDITAASGNAPAFLTPFEGGNFSRAVIALIQSEYKTLDINRDGEIDWSEAFAFLRQQTREFSWLSTKTLLALGFEFGNLAASEQIPFAYALGEPLTLSNETKSEEVEVTQVFQKQDSIISRAHSAKPTRGIRIQPSVSFPESLAGHRIRIGARFLDIDGKPIEPAYPYKEFTDDDGNVSAHQEFLLDKDKLLFGANNPIDLFMPYHLLPPEEFDGSTLSFELSVADLDTKTTPYVEKHKIIGTSKMIRAVSAKKPSEFLLEPIDPKEADE